MYDIVVGLGIFFNISHPARPFFPGLAGRDGGGAGAGGPDPPRVSPRFSILDISNSTNLSRRDLLTPGSEVVTPRFSILDISNSTHLSRRDLLTPGGEVATPPPPSILDSRSLEFDPPFPPDPPHPGW